ncbi:hypothetical protein RT43_GL001862 [Enterococcus italicus DSM 15952]|nr:hypothetical protein RT43_GL001862 [Enterococcus italicus DSM 15952]
MSPHRSLVLIGFIELGSPLIAYVNVDESAVVVEDVVVDDPEPQAAKKSPKATSPTLNHFFFPIYTFSSSQQNFLSFVQYMYCICTVINLTSLCQITELFKRDSFFCDSIYLSLLLVIGRYYTSYLDMSELA